MDDKILKFSLNRFTKKRIIHYVKKWNNTEELRTIKPNAAVKVRLRVQQLLATKNVFRNNNPLLSQNSFQSRLHTRLTVI